MSGPLGSSQWMYASGAEAAQQSLKFNDDESQYLSWTPASAGNRKTWTWSGWVKRGNLGSTQNFIAAATGTSDPTHTTFRFDGASSILFAGWSGVYFASNATFRDVSAWYHIVAVLDTTNATASDRIKVYVNGERLTGSNPVSIGSSVDLAINNTQEHSIGRSNYNAGSSYLDGYLSDINFIDGQALDASSFGETVDGYWKAKDYAGSYGTNGFHLTFQDDVVSEGFNAVTYTGNGGTQSISGLGFEPDFVWIKNRNTTESHTLFDTIRGAGERLFSNLTSGDNTASNSLTSFDADGFSVGSHSGVNTSGHSNVAWCWDAGSGSAASNTDGSITSTVKANPDYGFSILNYVGNGTAGSTIGHGLSGVDMLIIKDRDSAQDWNVYHKDVGTTNILALNSTSAAYADGAAMINSTAPSASLITLGFGGASNGSGRDYIAYCFAEVAGYSKISSYTGTGAAGNVVTTGFRPAFLLYKRTDAAANDWVIMDTTRSPSNPVEKRLFPNLSDAESAGAGGGIDVTDTGFVINNTYANANASGGTYIYMAFADTREAAFWKDVSGQGNHWTPNNLDYRDSLPDSPANNFATMNPLLDTTGNITFSEGSLKTVDTNASTSGSSIAVSSGKWFAEMVCTAKTASNAMVGICTVDGFDSDRQLDESLIGGSGYGYVMNGSKLPGGAAYGATWAIGDIIGIALDLDSAQNTVTFYKNGSSQGAININNAEYVFCNSNGQGTSTVTYVSNFGQDSTFAGAKPMGAFTDDNSIGNFQYAPPTGYLALCTQNLPATTIIDGSEYFNTVLYTGTGATQSITGVNHQPDLVWIKTRNTASQHVLTDSVRGVSKQLFSSLTNAETTEAGKGVTSFDSDGFTLGTELSVTGSTNNGSITYAAWNWKAGGTAVSNTDGSITSQVSANTTAGVSIVSWVGNGTSGATIGHSLGVKPSMMIIKNRDDSDAGSAHWLVYHEALGATHRVKLDSTEASGATAVHFNNTEPTSSVFTVNTSNAGNGSGDAMIAYCFADVEGFSKAGSYTGNGSTDGTFVYTGFRPAWVMTKRTETTSSWSIIDVERSSFNEMNDTLFPNLSNAENVATTYVVDCVSNGFKIRGTNGALNASGGSYIYLAFASSPFKYANAR